MAIAFVSGTSAQSSTGTGVTSGTFDSTGANLLIVPVTFYGTTDPTITDSKGNTWPSTMASRNGSNTGSIVFYAVNPTVGSGHTVTIAGGTLYQSCAPRAYSGAHTSTPFEQAALAAATSTSLTFIEVTPMADNDLLLAVEGFDGATGRATSVSTGFTIVVNVNATANAEGIDVATEIQTTATARTMSFNDGSDSRAGVLAVFKVAAAAGGDGNKLLLMGVG